MFPKNGLRFTFKEGSGYSRYRERECYDQDNTYSTSRENHRDDNSLCEARRFVLKFRLTAHK